MTEGISRVEFDDLLRHLTAKVERCQHQAAVAREMAEAHERMFAIVNFAIQQLQRLVISLLPAEQRELFAAEQSAGITAAVSATETALEPNDGNEWRARLTQVAATRRERLEREAASMVHQVAPGRTVLDDDKLL